MELPSIGVEPPNVDGEALREYWLREECRVEVVFFLSGRGVFQWQIWDFSSNPSTSSPTIGRWIGP